MCITPTRCGWWLGSAEDGTVLAWGMNRMGQLGLGHTDSVCIPTPVGGALKGVRVARLAAGGMRSYVVTGTFHWL